MAINRKLGKTTDQRLAMLKCLATDLILRGKIETTEARAKEVKSIVRHGVRYLLGNGCGTAGACQCLPCSWWPRWQFLCSYGGD